MGFFSCFNKLFLIALNFIVFIFGTGIVILASMVIHKSQAYGDMLINQGMVSLPIVVLIVGLFIAMLGFFGCCGAASENPCMLYTYASVVLCLFLSGLVIGILILLYPDASKSLIKEPLYKGFNKYGQKDASLDTVIDSFQHDFECCGINSYQDWKNTTYGKPPLSCCKLQHESCDINSPDDLFDVGCYNAVYHEIKKISQILGIATIILAIVQFLCICIACGLAKKRSQYV